MISKQQQNNYFHFTNEMTSRVIEYWPGRKNTSLDCFKFSLLARSSPLGYAAFLMFLKIGSMATSLKRQVHSPARQQVSDWAARLWKDLCQTKQPGSEQRGIIVGIIHIKGKEYSGIVLMFTDRIHDGGDQGWWSGSRTSIGPIYFV